VGKLMMTVLSGVAEFERKLPLQRTNERAPAQWPKARGSTASAR